MCIYVIKQSQNLHLQSIGRFGPWHCHFCKLCYDLWCCSYPLFTSLLLSIEEFTELFARNNPKLVQPSLVGHVVGKVVTKGACALCRNRLPDGRIASESPSGFTDSWCNPVQKADGWMKNGHWTFLAVPGQKCKVCPEIGTTCTQTHKITSLWPCCLKSFLMVQTAVKSRVQNISVSIVYW